MSTKVPLKVVIEKLVELNPDLDYDEIRQPFEEIITDSYYNRNISISASDVTK